METLEQRIQRVLQDAVSIVPYDPAWPELYRQEKAHLLSCLPTDLVTRIEHFGSTAVPGLAAKPVIDMLVEVTSLEETQTRIVPILETQGYDYFWRPTWGNDTPPYYAWFIKRAASGARTHHIHMVEHDFPHWERLLFRDYLIAHPPIARRYEQLKLELATQHAHDREAYTQAKTGFVVWVTTEARRWAEASRTP